MTKTTNNKATTQTRAQATLRARFGGGDSARILTHADEVSGLSAMPRIGLVLWTEGRSSAIILLAEGGETRTIRPTAEGVDAAVWAAHQAFVDGGEFEGGEMTEAESEIWDAAFGR